MAKHHVGKKAPHGEYRTRYSYDKKIQASVIMAMLEEAKEQVHGL